GDRSAAPWDQTTPGVTKSSDSPDSRRRQLDAVAGGIAEVDRAAAAGPLEIGLDLDPVVAQARLPRVEAALGDGEGNVRGTGRAVCRDGARRARRRARVEDEQHPVTAAKEHVAAVGLRLDLEPEHAPVEVRRRAEVGGIESGLEDAEELRHVSRASAREGAFCQVRAGAVPRPFSTDCTVRCGNVDYSKSAKCESFRCGAPCTSLAGTLDYDC